MKETSGSGAAVDPNDDPRGENQLRQERGFLRPVDTIISAVGVLAVAWGVWVAIDTLESIEKSVTVAENQLNLSAEQFAASFNARLLDQRPWLPFSRAEIVPTEIEHGEYAIGCTLTPMSSRSPRPGLSCLA